ncbi:hypothetical protein, partial [Pseudomonas syringae group genomosp. 3]|uniref:hypothetical protein n=1 Tax=Pseudomonas syringae group genomosp. 3 TaxID=251701 RepID=UPI0011AA4998
VTYVALCVVSDIAIEKRFRLCAVVNYRATLCVLFVALRVIRRFCKVSDVCLRLKAPSRLSATDFEGSK